MAYREVSDLPSYPPPIPPLDPTAYRLQVGGAVNTPLALSLDELQQLPHITITADFTCLEGWVAANRSWQGVALRTVLERAGVLPLARYVAVHGADHDGAYNVLLTREQALAPTSVLALAREGQPLTHDHGAPVRLQVPGADCFLQVKWVMRVEALADPVPARGPEIALARLRTGKGSGAG